MVTTGSKRLEINLGKRCNCNCLICLDQKGEEVTFIPFDLLKKELLEGVNRGYKSINILGGEPTIYPQILSIVRFASLSGYKEISIQTNGLKLSNYQFLEELVLNGVTRIMLSIHSHKEEVEDKLTGIKGSFTHKLKAIENIMSLIDRGYLKDGFALTPVVNRLNLSSLISYVSFFKRLNIDDIRFTLLRPSGNARKNLKKVVPILEKLPSQLEKLIEKNEVSFKIKLTFGDFPFCVLPWKLSSNKILLKKYISHLYDPSSFTIVYHGNKHSLCAYLESFFWENKRKKELKYHVAICKRCKYIVDCEGIWKEYVEIYGEGIINPPLWCLY